MALNAAQAAVTDIATAPLSTNTSTVTAKPNVMFMLDDSGSMDWDYLPDLALSFSGDYGYNSSQCNGIAYNPNFTYTPPVYSDGTSYPNSSFTAAWVNGYSPGSGTVNLNTGFTGGSGTGSSGERLTAGPAFYYTYSGAQTTPALQQYFNTNSTFWKECSSTIGSAPGNAVFTKVTLSSSAPQSTITVSNAGTAGATITVNSVGSSGSKPSISSITVNGTQLLASPPVPSSSSTNTEASNIATAINRNGYTATVSGNIVTINCAAAGATFSPVLTYSGTMTYAVTACPAVSNTTVSSITVNGAQILTASATGSTPSALAAAIAANTGNSYSATASSNTVTVTGPNSAGGFTPAITVSSGTQTLSATAFPVVATAAQLQNFANWYSYYSTRMLTMKTGAGQAFALLNNSYRIGFMTMNNNVSPDFLDIADFTGGCAVGSGACQRDLWYTKLYASQAGNSTPLREALSHVGQLYAHKFGNITTYTATITVSGSATGQTVSDITMSGTATMPDTSVAASTTSQVATNIANQINAMVVTNYGATVSGSVISITGTVADLGTTPVIVGAAATTGGMTFTATPFVANTVVAQLNGVTPLDPVQYSCQQNFVILSTDGYWNGPNTYNLSNGAVGNQDGTESRPMFDGTQPGTMTTTQVNQTTTQALQQTQQVQSRTETLQRSAWALQSSTYALQQSAWQLQKRTKSGGVWSAWANAAACTWGSSTQCQYTGPTVTTVASCTVSALTTATVNGTVYNPSAVTCAYSGAPTVNNNAVACTVVSQSTTSPYSGPSVSCAYVNPTVTNVGSCTVSAKTTSTANGTVYNASAVTCGYSPGAWGNVASCTPVAMSTSSPYTVGSALDCQVSGTGTWTPVAPGTCTAGSAGGQTISCSTTTVGPNPVASCTPAAAAAGNAWTATACNTVTVGPTPSSNCTAAAASASNNYTATTCVASTGGASNTLADVAEYYYMTDLRDNTLGNCTGALGLSVCPDNVPTTTLDWQTQQHMTTFTLGLGARGYMIFNSLYAQDAATTCDPTTDDFCAVLKGSTANGTTTCSWQTSGTTCNWPIPSSGSAANIDDLWHAAVNGRGSYFSATNPGSLASGLSNTLQGIVARVGASAAAATSNPNVSSGDNFVFSTSYTSVDWTGEVTRQQINLITGIVTGTPDWSAQALLDTLDASAANGGARHIYAYNPTATAYTGDAATLNNHKLKTFTYNNLTATEQAYYSQAHISGLSQMCAVGPYCLSGANQAAAAGANLVNYLRGDRTNEGDTTTNTTFYRARKHILGDIVDAEAAYVRVPNFSYGDVNYSGYATAQSSRSGMVYAASNDGMLHALNAGGATITPGDNSGEEAWAYVPNIVEPNLYLLADKNYSTQHEYLVDGTPITGDICPNAPATTCTAAQWRTILVGGLNDGGRGYYALDVTDPANPQALWEFTDANMGNTFGNPVITKLRDGTWVVLVTSGYNNVPNTLANTGDGVGRLYVLNAYTGALIRSISTGVGSTATPSGLARIAARVSNPSTDNTTLEVYGGDLLGNLWRFDINNDVGNYTNYPYAAQLLAVLKAPDGSAQPITTKPEVGIVNNQLAVFVGTGKFLGTSDLTTTQVQTMYAILDPFLSNSVPGTAIYNNPRATTCTNASPTNCFVQQVATNTTCPAGTSTSICTQGQAVRTGTNNPVSLGTQDGWYVDMPDSGERINTDPTLALGTLGFVSNTPSTGTACTVLGYSYSWVLNYQTGAPVTNSTSTVIATQIGQTFGTRPVFVHLPSGTVVELIRTSTGGTVTNNVPIGNAGGGTRRTSWRELIQQ